MSGHGLALIAAVVLTCIIPCASVAFIVAPVKVVPNNRTDIFAICGALCAFAGYFLLWAYALDVLA